MTSSMRTRPTAQPTNSVAPTGGWHKPIPIHQHDHAEMHGIDAELRDDGQQNRRRDQDRRRHVDPGIRERPCRGKPVAYKVGCRSRFSRINALLSKKTRIAHTPRRLKLCRLPRMRYELSAPASIVPLLKRWRASLSAGRAAASGAIAADRGAALLPAGARYRQL